MPTYIHKKGLEAGRHDSLSVPTYNLSAAKEFQALHEMFILPVGYAKVVRARAAETSRNRQISLVLTATARLQDQAAKQ